MIDTYYSKLDLSSRFLYKNTYLSSYNLIEHITLKFSFDYAESEVHSSASETRDLITASLFNFQFYANSNIKINIENNKNLFGESLNNCLHEISIFNKKKIQLLLNKYLMHALFKFDLKKYNFKSSSSTISFEIVLDNNDYNLFFPEVLKKKLNYNIPKIFLTIFLKKSLTNFLHF